MTGDLLVHAGIRQVSLHIPTSLPFPSSFQYSTKVPLVLTIAGEATRAEARMATAMMNLR